MNIHIMLIHAGRITVQYLSCYSHITLITI